VALREQLLFGDLEAATFQSRPNRYLAWVTLDGESVAAHVLELVRERERWGFDGSSGSWRFFISCISKSLGL